MRKLLWKIRNSVENEEGITTVEVILLLVVLIAVVLVLSVTGVVIVAVRLSKHKK